MKKCEKCGAMLAMVEGYEWTMTGWIKSEPREIYHECHGENDEKIHC